MTYSKRPRLSSCCVMRCAARGRKRPFSRVPFRGVFFFSRVDQAAAAGGFVSFLLSHRSRAMMRGDDRLIFQTGLGPRA